MIFLKGYILGLGMILFIGPVFFLLLSISLQLGTKAGILVALGILLSDVVCVYLCYFGVASFLYEPDSKLWVSLAGGIILMLLGVKYLIKPASKLEIQSEVLGLDYLACFIKGFLVNFVNPFVFLVWIGVIAYLHETKLSEHDSYIYLAGTLCAILSTDLLKVFSARQLKSILKPKALKFIFRICGIALICFGIRLFFYLTKHFEVLN